MLAPTPPDSFASSLPFADWSRRKRLLGALFAGAVCALGLPPLGLFPALWLGLPFFLLLLQPPAGRRLIFALGWCFGFGYFVPGLYWIAAAMFVDLKRFFWMVPFTVAGLPAILGCYYGLAALLRRKLDARGLPGTLALALLLAIADYARGYLFSGFPWNLFAYVWTDFLPLAQINSVIGSYGLNLLTLLAALLPGALALRAPRARAVNLFAMLLLLTLGLWGQWRLQHNPAAYASDATVRLVQPNIAQTLKWDIDEKERNFQTLLALSAAPADEAMPRPSHIIWPETAATYYLAEEPGRRAQIAAALPKDAILLTGAVRRAANEATRRWDYYNSLLALDGQGAIIAHYDKFHLVPFGEYVPFRSFGPIAATTAGIGAFVPGPGPQSLTVPGLPNLSPLICYEVIFPHRVTDPDKPPQLLVNITNDGWYGNSSGPYQHLAIARMRAIEEGLPLLRAANTGISAVVDAYGRTMRHLPLGEQGVIDTAVPQAIPASTIYASYGDLLWLAGWLILFLAVLTKRSQNALKGNG